MKNENVIIEENCQLSKSKLWDFQEHYFAEQGVSAWMGAVPFYVTSNAVICYSYANVVCRYLQDSYRLGKLNVKHPIYLLEIGAGCGQFSYLFLQFLLGRLEKIGLSELSICYIMTDFTEKNVSFWQQHHQLKSFVDRGVLDFSIYDIHQEYPELTLIESGVTLTKSAMHNPLVLIANYVFDTIKQDVFRVEQGEIYEGLTSISTERDNISQDDMVFDLSLLNIHFSFKKISEYYYNNESLNNILKLYRNTLKSSTFLMPVGGIRCIDYLRDLSNNRLFIISGDKSYTTLSALEQLGSPHITFHGGFSMMVNYHAIETFIKNMGGDAIMGANTEGFKISIFATDHSFIEYRETQIAYEEFIHHFTTKEFLPIKNNLLKNVTAMNSVEMLALLKLSRWDAKIVMQVTSELTAILQTAGKAYKQECRDGLIRSYYQYYYMPNNDLYITYGYIHMMMGDIDIAIDRFYSSLKYFSTSALLYAYLSYCFNHKHEYDKAKQYCKQSLALDSECQLAKDLYKSLSKLSQ